MVINVCFHGDFLTTINSDFSCCHFLRFLQEVVGVRESQAVEGWSCWEGDEEENKELKKDEDNDNDDDDEEEEEEEDE